MNLFVINGKEYKAKPFDFNLVCDLEDMGVSLVQAQDKSMSMMRAYFALCAEMERERAGNEIESHIISGGKLDDVMGTMFNEMEKSDFFRSLNKGEEAETQENPKPEEEDTQMA